MRNRLIKLCIISIGLLSLISNNKIYAVTSQYAPFLSSHIVSRDTTGTYGNHKYENYYDTKTDTQYYRDGDVVEVKVVLPPNNGSHAISEYLIVDQSKVELLTVPGDMTDTMDSSYQPKDWISELHEYSDSQQVSLIIIAGSNKMGDYAKDIDGGVVSKIYFRILEGVESEDGVEIKFKFSSFSAIEDIIIDGERHRIYNHKGYDPNNLDTTEVDLPDVVIIAKTPQELMENDDVVSTQNEVVYKNKRDRTFTFQSIDKSKISQNIRIADYSESATELKTDANAYSVSEEIVSTANVLTSGNTQNQKDITFWILFIIMVIISILGIMISSYRRNKNRN